MNIILQNYNNLINKLIKDYFFNKIDRIINIFEFFSINNYINLISSFDECMNDFIKCAFVNLIRKLDKNYMNSIERKEKILEYKNYILKHWNNIINVYKYTLSCPMESQISHTFASYFTSRPKAYNKNMINKLINLRLLKKNRYNIKKLYLNNLNKMEIINLNNKTFDFSLFDKKKKNN